jgi:hypothetical protein
MFGITSAQVHLAFNHLPVVGALIAAAVLVLGAVRGHQTVRRLGLSLLVFAALAALPTYFSGDGAEEIVEHRPGVSERVIERHEHAARDALIAILVGGGAAAGALVALRLRRERVAGPLFGAALVVSLAATGLLVRTAHLGGMIRHDELRAAPTAADAARDRDRDDDDDDDDEARAPSPAHLLATGVEDVACATTSACCSPSAPT